MKNLLFNTNDLICFSVFPPRASSRFSQVVGIRFPKPALLIWANIVIPAGKNAPSLTANPISAPFRVRLGWKTFISVSPVNITSSVIGTLLIWQ